MDYRELIIYDILSKMSDEEKQRLYGLVLNGKGQKEIMDLLKSQQNELREIKKGQSWVLDLSSNVVGNALWDSLIWVGGKLLRMGK